MDYPLVAVSLVFELMLVFYVDDIYGNILCQNKTGRSVESLTDKRVGKIGEGGEVLDDWEDSLRRW